MKLTRLTISIAIFSIVDILSPYSTPDVRQELFILSCSEGNRLMCRIYEEIELPIFPI